MKLNEFSVYTYNKVIIAYLAGTIDEVAAIKYCNDVEKCIDSFNGQQFGCLINGLDTIGCTPKAFEVFEKHNQWIKEKPMVAKAVVVPDDISSGILIKRIASFETQNVKMFEDEKSAKGWLEQQLVV